MSIVKFTIPGNLDCLCVLNPRGRRKYGSLLELLASGNGVLSTVGLQDGSRAMDVDQRVSTKFTSVIDFVFHDRDVLEGLVDGFLSGLMQQEDYLRWSSSSTKYEVIAYEPGGFFRPHRDRRTGPKHYGTLLIFPPATGAFAHVGGDLVFEEEDGMVFQSSTVAQWTFLAFRLGVLHECRPVISGRRVVIKAELHTTDFCEPYEFMEPIVD